MAGPVAEIPVRASRGPMEKGGITMVRRGLLKVYDDRMEFADWRLPFSRISDVRHDRRLYRQGGEWSVRKHRLRLNDGAYRYKFRIDQPDTDLPRHLPVSVTSRDVRVHTGGPLVWLIALIVIGLVMWTRGLLPL